MSILLSKCTTVRGRGPKLLGRGPVSLLSLILKLCNDVASAMEDGIAPVRKLCDPSKYARDVKPPIDAGREPDILFEVKMRDTKLVTAPSDGGRAPVRALLDTSKDDRTKNLSMPTGKGPVK